MNATQSDTVRGSRDRRVGDVRYVTEPAERRAERRVVGFYRSIGLPFFGAVVSTCSSHEPATGSYRRPEPEPCPTSVTLLGELDASTAPLLRECFARIEGDIEVDCSGLDFVDAHGLRDFCLRTRAM
jgi:hypothetical protein